MLQVVDENAVASSRPVKSGAGDGLRGIKDTARPAFGKSQAAKLQGKPTTSQPKTRTALGDLTNSMKGISFGPIKLPQPNARTVSEPPVEQMAGKGWKLMETEILQQAEEELQQRIGRVSAAAASWTTSHLYHEEHSSDDETSSVGCPDERVTEVPLIVHMLEPRYAPGVSLMQPASGFDMELYNLLPGINSSSIDMGFLTDDNLAPIVG